MHVVAGREEDRRVKIEDWQQTDPMSDEVREETGPGTMEARLATLEAIVRRQQGEIQRLRDRVGLLEAEAGHMPESNKRAKLAPPPADAFSPLGDEAVSLCASYLGACDLVQLGRTCRRFGAGRDGGRPSLVDGAARQMFHEAATACEKECLTRYEGEETHVKLLKELEGLRKPLELDILFAGVSHFGGTKATIQCGRSTDYAYDQGSAISSHIMRSGRHYAKFKVKQMAGDAINIGIIRPLLKKNDRMDFNFHPVGRIALSSYEGSLISKLLPKFDRSSCNVSGVDGCLFSRHQIRIWAREEEVGSVGLSSSSLATLRMSQLDIISTVLNKHARRLRAPELVEARTAQPRRVEVDLEAPRPGVRASVDADPPAAHSSAALFVVAAVFGGAPAGSGRRAREVGHGATPDSELDLDRVSVAVVAVVGDRRGTPPVRQIEAARDGKIDAARYVVNAVPADFPRALPRRLLPRRRPEVPLQEVVHLGDETADPVEVLVVLPDVLGDGPAARGRRDRVPALLPYGRHRETPRGRDSPGRVFASPLLSNEAVTGVAGEAGQGESLYARYRIGLPEIDRPKLFLLKATIPRTKRKFLGRPRLRHRWPDTSLREPGRVRMRRRKWQKFGPVLWGLGLVISARRTSIFLSPSGL
ncbi:hypothetical protein THAOC_14493 [Thalassiosira oceanica]|uniref:F-box domain-containing protein n=1 Tax=Thalassiosira oceanica TaxID=159749 RepID=K0T2W6_THAOC|nr:hypothetical protein THAOC_14493 [Thalassiosira oceanica]|eukprot:EJK64742.1 hypothetical protein THAOC_14493 [Thalassiosira oceanica]